MAITGNTILRNIRPASSKYGVQGEPPMWQAVIKDTVVVDVGDVLIVDTGEADVAANGATSVSILGVAATAGTGITAPTFRDATVPNSPVRGIGPGIVNYYPALPGMAFIGHVAQDVAGTPTDETAAQATFFTQCGVGLVSGIYCLDQTQAVKVATILDICIDQIDLGSGTPPAVPPAGLYKSQDEVIAAAVRNPLVVFTFTSSVWNTIA